MFFRATLALIALTFLVLAVAVLIVTGGPR